jgi:RNA polymerase sporulation-specific sigma factor
LAAVLAMNEKMLEEISDEQLVKEAQQGSNEALEAILSRYKNLVYSKAKPYFLAGAEDDDIIQEGFIGLYKAVMDFNGDRFPFFKVFAGVCVTRHILTAVKAASRKKHLPLNSYVSLDKNTYDEDGDTTLLDVMAFNELQDPEAILIDRENVDGMEYKINKVLSKLELEVLVYYLKGMSYGEIAQKLGKDIKSVDNAVQRIKKKLETALRDGD